jgi:NAD(P)-dependent dehydrogenase (short-subunit alcohol dehydrogenase family)
LEKLSRFSVVITGATSGIGLAAVEALVEAGAFVIGVGRNAERNSRACQSVKQKHPDGQCAYLLADLSSQSQVEKLAKSIGDLLEKNHFPYLDVLINNAGVYQGRKILTEDGIELTFAVDHLAPFFLTHKLLPFLNKSEKGRVLTVSSYSHFTTPLNLNRIANPKPYLSLLAYKRAKLCNVLFTYELNRRYADITAFAIDPGLVNTSIASKGSRGISHWVWKHRRNDGTSAKLPAQTLLYLATVQNPDTSNGYYIKNCEPKAPSKKAQDPQLAQKLWELSCKLTHTDW